MNWWGDNWFGGQWFQSNWFNNGATPEPPPTDEGGFRQFHRGSGQGSGTPGIELVVEITYYDIDAEIVEELCRLGLDCCSFIEPPPPPPPTSGSTGSQGNGELCDHDFVHVGGGTSGGPDQPCTIDPTLVPRWFLEQFVAMVNGLPAALVPPYLPYVQLISACLANPANITDAEIRDCMNFTGSAGVPPNPSYYSYMVTQWGQWLQNNEADAIAACLGLPTNGSGTGSSGGLQLIDIERIELELDGDAIQEAGKTCIVINDENCDICNLASLTV